MPEQFDLIVVGSGGMGSSAFYHAAMSGRRVLALDRFPAAHDRGSSHGESRIIRQAYFEHPNYVPLLLDAYQLWDQLEKNTQRQLFIHSGLLEVGFPDGPIIRGILESSEQYGVAVEQVSENQFRKQFPMFDKLDSQVVVVEPQAGYLLVEKCVQAHIDAAVELGGTIRSGVTVVDIVPEKKQVEIVTETESYTASQVIVTAGAWSAELLSWIGVDLRVLRKHLYWFDATTHQSDLSNGVPSYFYETDTGYYYGFPAIDGRIKVARHSGGDNVDDPLNVDRSSDSDDLGQVQKFLRQYLRYEAAQPNRHAICMYTMTANEHFIVDRHPDCDQIVFAAGMSGHGFKFSPVIGRQLVRLLDGESDARFEFLSVAAHQTN